MDLELETDFDHVQRGDTESSPVSQPYVPSHSLTTNIRCTPTHRENNPAIPPARTTCRRVPYPRQPTPSSPPIHPQHTYLIFEVLASGRHSCIWECPYPSNAQYTVTPLIFPPWFEVSRCPSALFSLSRTKSTVVVEVELLERPDKVKQ